MTTDRRLNCPWAAEPEPHARLLGARRTSTKNRFRRTTPVRRNTPNLTLCSQSAAELHAPPCLPTVDSTAWRCDIRRPTLVFRRCRAAPPPPRVSTPLDAGPLLAAPTRASKQPYLSLQFYRLYTFSLLSLAHALSLPSRLLLFSSRFVMNSTLHLHVEILTPALLSSDDTRSCRNPLLSCLGFLPQGGCTVGVHEWPSVLTEGVSFLLRIFIGYCGNKSCLVTTRGRHFFHFPPGWSANKRVGKAAS